MISSITHNAEVKDGRVRIMNRPLFDQKISEMKPGMYTISLKIIGNSRTARQNAYMWAIFDVLVHYFREQGYRFDEYDIYDLCVGKFNTRPIYDPTTGETRFVAKGTSKLTTDEFADFIEKIRDWSLEKLDLYIETPDEYYARMEF